jgi:hypothetical protein
VLPCTACRSYVWYATFWVLQNACTSSARIHFCSSSFSYSSGLFSLKFSAFMLVKAFVYLPEPYRRLIFVGEFHWTVQGFFLFMLACAQYHWNLPLVLLPSFWKTQTVWSLHIEHFYFCGHMCCIPVALVALCCGLPELLAAWRKVLDFFTVIFLTAERPWNPQFDDIACTLWWCARISSFQYYTLLFLGTSILGSPYELIVSLQFSNSTGFHLCPTGNE